MKTKTMSVKEDKLCIGEFRLSELARKYKTPLFVYDEAHVRNKLDIFKNNFRSELYECEVTYASKAFISPYICNIIKEYDMGIDSVSLGDLYILKKSGFPMSRVVMHGNNKSEEELLFCIENKIQYLVVDNLQELKTLDKLTKELKMKIDILIRVNPGVEAHTHDYIKTAMLNSKFGESIYDLKRISEMIAIANNSDYINLSGFHSHIGSNINSARAYVGQIRLMTGFIKTVLEKYNFKTKVLNIGGGFAIKYTENDIDVDLEHILKSIIRSVNHNLGRNGLKIEKLMIEPGRSIIGDAGVTVYEVGGLKKTHGGKEYIFVDGGMSDNIRPALYQAKYTVDIANRMNDEKYITYDVAGKLCESGDVIANDVTLGKVKKGDYLITYATGAYCYSMASNYNSAVKPGVIFVNEGKVNVVIKRESLDDLVKNAKIDMKIFDVHTDILYDLYTSKKKQINNRFDLHVEQLENNLIRGGLWTMYSPDDFDLLEACTIALEAIDIDRLPGFEVILGLEGLRNLKSIEDLDSLYKLGFRHAMLTWNEENEYAAGVKSSNDKGLTAKGQELVEKMASLDMIIDLAHLNEKSFYDVLNVTNNNIIYSHGNVRALCNHKRNVTDEQMKALKAADGLLGLTLVGSFVSEDDDKKDVKHYLDHLEYAIKFMGIDNVCIGFDFMDYLEEKNKNLIDLPNANYSGRLIEEMKKRGFTEEEIFKITFDNFYRRYHHKIYLRGQR